MTRLPELERELVAAARRLDRRRPWWKISLLGGGATLLVAATAYAAAGLLEGDPVPPSVSKSVPKVQKGTSVALSPRAPDPEGGLPWGIAATGMTAGKGSATGKASATGICIQAGRVQDGRLGVIGRDGTFNDDGRFHPLGTDANQSGTCGGISIDGNVTLGDDGPPIPASGFTGGFLTAAGGCRENVPASTMSPQIRRRLRNVPVCKDSSLRIVKYGLAGRKARKLAYGNDRITLHATPRPDENGAYIFVLTPKQAGTQPLTLTITYRNGTTCRSTFPFKVTGRRMPLPCGMAKARRAK